MKEVDSIDLSIIIPVYNVERWLRGCLDSVLGQTVQSAEVIVVDDGSTDGSGVICDEYAEKDARVRVIHQKNGGQSAARNAGIDIARGEFITFIDSDDTYGRADLLERNLELLRGCAEADFVQFTFKKVWDEGYDKGQQEWERMIKNANGYGVWKLGQGVTTGEDGSGEGVSCSLGKDKLYEYYFMGVITDMPCDKIFRRGVFDGRRYQVGVYYEDGLFIVDALDGLRGALLSDAGFYSYNIREGSTMTGRMSEKKYLDRVHISQHMAEYALRERAVRGVFLNLNRIYSCVCNGKRDYGMEFMKDEAKEVDKLMPSVGYILREGPREMGVMSTMKFMLKKLLGAERFAWLRLKLG